MQDTASNKPTITVENSLLIPAGRAALISVALAIAVFCGALWWEWGRPLALAGLVWGLSFPLALLWFWAQADDRLHPQERVHADPVQTYTQTIIKAQVIATDPDGAYSSAKLFDFQVDPARFKLMCERLLDGASPTLAEFGGRGKIFSRSEFEAIRAVLIKRGMMAWVNPHSTNCGAVVTRGGRAFLEEAIRRISLTHPDPELPTPNEKRYTSRVHTGTQRSADRWEHWKEVRGIPTS